MKKITLALIALATVFTLAACGGDTGDKTTKKNDETSNKVTVWAWDPTFNIKALEEADKAYNKSESTLDIVSILKIA